MEGRFQMKFVRVSLGLGLGLLVCVGCGDDSQIMNPIDGGGDGAAGSGGSGGTGGMGGMGGSGGMGGTGGSGVDAGFISIGRGTAMEQETHVQADPSGKVVVAWIAVYGGYSGNGYNVSHDKGATWMTTPGEQDSPTPQIGSDPSLAVDSQGNFYLSWVGYEQQGGNPSATNMHIYVSKMAVGSDTFAAAVPVSDDGSPNTSQLDKPWIFVDNSNAVLVFWTDFGTDLLKVARSTNGFATMPTAAIVGGGDVPSSFGNLMFPCQDPAGGPNAPIFVVYIQSHTVRVRKSVNSGMAWANPSTALPATDAVFQMPGCATQGQNLWVVYAQGTGMFTSQMAPSGDAMMIAHSTNGGTSYTGTTLSDGAAGTQYLNPAIALSSSGALQATYLQGIMGSAPRQLVRAVSTDGGSSWMRTVEFSSAGPMTFERGSLSWPGDYIGLTINGSDVYAVFGDASALSQHDHIRFLHTTTP